MSSTEFRISRPILKKDNFTEGLTRGEFSARITSVLAGIAHLVERHLAKVEVASSSLVARSRLRQDIRPGCPVFSFRKRTRCLHPAPEARLNPRRGRAPVNDG